MANNHQSFWQFSDQLRVHTENMANLSLNDSIWSSDYTYKRPGDRKNFDVSIGGSGNTSNTLKAATSDLYSFTDHYKHVDVNGGNVRKDFNGLNFNWKSDLNNFVASAFQMNVNGAFNKGVYSRADEDYQTDVNLNANLKAVMMKKKVDNEHGGKGGQTKSNRKNSNDGSCNNECKTVSDKRFKTLPPAEALRRNETVGGYIFVCNNDTMEENLQRQLFGLPPRYRDSVRQITPGLPLFLYNYSNHQLHGVFESASFGGSNIDPTAWEDKKYPGESRFPAQVRVVTRKVYESLEEDSFRPILHHYDGPKFRLELNVPEAISLLDVFAEQE